LGKSIPLAYVKMKEENKNIVYPCVCMKCAQKYESENEQDTFGDGYCKTCIVEVKAIAAAIDEKFKNRPPKKRPPRFDELPIMPGTNYIDYKGLI